MRHFLSRFGCGVKLLRQRGAFFVQTRLAAMHNFDYNLSMTLVADKLGTHAGGLRIGSLQLQGRALLAPMAGVTDLGMRRLARRFGAALAVSEMVSSDALGRRQARLRLERGDIELHSVQIAGCDPTAMAEAARLAEGSGAAIIDINMGCPVRKVTGGYAGSALMRDLDRALTLVKATIAAVQIPVTLKMRLGWDDASRNAPELARRAEAEGVSLVSVHGRTRCQFYDGHADWRAIAAVKAAVRIPVVANGDCLSTDDAVEMLRLSGADAVMIGRGAIGRPWFVGDIAHHLATGRSRPEYSADARLAVALEHYETILSLYGRNQGLRHARKHIAAYARHAGAEIALRQRLVTSEEPRDVMALLAQAFMAPQLLEAA